VGEAAITEWARRTPDAPAVISPTGNRTFAELDARANQLARALRRRGLVPGDAVALMCSNRPEFVEVFAACIRAGWRLTPVNWHLTGGEAAYVVDDCEARALVLEAGIPAAVGLGESSSDLVARLAVGGAIEDFDAYEDALAAEDSSELEDTVEGGVMLYTSGTTGRPKGVHRVNPRLGTENIAGYRPGDLHLCTGPLYHAAPLGISLAPPLANGAGVVVMGAWDAEEALRLIDRHRITQTHMVPTMFHRLLALPAEVRERYDVSSLRLVVHGAAPCPVSVKQRIIEWFGPVVVEYYAATEGSGTLVDSATWLARPGTVGRPADGHIIVGDEDANPLPAGETGLVWLRMVPGSEFRYFKDDAKTEGAQRGDRFTLGDVGHLDEDGFLFLTDRDVNLIISGGVNIYPAEVDAVLLDHPAVADAATIGVPDEEWGEQVKAVLELHPGATGDDALVAELIGFCRDRLAPFKCPRSVDFVDTLPRNDNGKIYKRLLRERYRADAG